MNVHRRDRARLRLQSPTILESNPNPNPNPNSNPNPNPTFLSSPLPPLLSPNSFSSSTAAGGGSHEMKNGDLTKMGCAKFEENGKECSEVVKRSEFLRLDLGIGLISESKDDLDLELRLGYI
ncbi:hypothetical protein MTR67_041324 [Solanum verrucosum]|uniref:Uncharacterized protein n=1 Tax=Solanum verrucosum TaxID=315347 RepID=A0AAF0UMI2_SOLVR|nr:hypothetical protein MTR67_041324 [Solanum verrucosum]